MLSGLRQFIFREDHASRRPSLIGYGKHRAWDDHVEDLGEHTELLIATKRRLYKGLANQLETGAWDKLDPENRLAAYNHSFMWQLSAGYVVGVLVSSVDGKGRNKYPFVLAGSFPRNTAAQTLYATEALLADAAPVLCELGTREQVRARLAGIQARARSPADSAPPNAALGGDTPAIPLQDAARVYHDLKNRIEFGRKTPSDAHALIRVNVSSAAPGVDPAWRSFFDGILEEAMERLYIRSRQTTTMDIIAGAALPEDFFCLRYNERALPSTTSIPFDISDATISAATQALRRCEPPANRGAASAKPPD